MTAPAPRPVRLVVVAASLLLLAACNSDSTGPRTPVGTTTSAVTVRLASATPLSGLSLVLPHPVEFTAITVVPGPLLAGASCAQNPEPTALRVACVSGAPFAGPGTAWVITFSHPDDRTAALVGPATCTGSLADGSTLPVSCDLL